MDDLRRDPGELGTQISMSWIWVDDFSFVQWKIHYFLEFIGSLSKSKMSCGHKSSWFHARSSGSARVLAVVLAYEFGVWGTRPARWGAHPKFSGWGFLAMKNRGAMVEGGWSSHFWGHPKIIPTLRSVWLVKPVSWRHSLEKILEDVQVSWWGPGDVGQHKWWLRMVKWPTLTIILTINGHKMVVNECYWRVFNPTNMVIHNPPEWEYHEIYNHQYDVIWVCLKWVMLQIIVVNG